MVATGRHRVESELAFQSWVTGTADLFGWQWFHDWDPVRNNAGFPDLHLYHEQAGLYVVAELKVPGGIISPEQLGWLRACKRAGLRTYIWRPEDRAEILRILDWQKTGAHLT